MKKNKENREGREIFTNSLKKGNLEKVKILSAKEKMTIGEILDEGIEERYEKVIVEGDS